MLKHKKIPDETTSEEVEGIVLEEETVRIISSNYGTSSHLSGNARKSLKNRRLLITMLVLVIAILCITIGLLVQPKSNKDSLASDSDANQGPLLGGTSIHSMQSCPSGTYELKSSRRTRKFDLYTPSGATADSSIVFVWHGFGSDPPTVSPIVNIQPYADEHNWIVVFPWGDGLLGAFNGKGCCDAAPNDVQLASDIIDYLDEIQCGDRNRVFSTGFSNGGFMNHKLGCDAPSLFKAIAVHSGLIGKYAGSLPDWKKFKGCLASISPPILAIHGTEDKIVKLNGGTFANLYGVDTMSWYSFFDTMNIWKKKHHCNGEDIVEDVTSTTQCITNSGCAGSWKQCTVTGLDHSWSGNKDDADDIQATKEICNFFLNHGA